VDAGPLRDVLTVVLGVATGVLSAAFGVGGAVVSTPGIRALGASALIAIGTTLPSILPSAASGSLRYSHESLVDWRVVAWTAPTGVAGSVGGSLLSGEVPGEGHWLMVLTAVLLALTAYRMVPRTGEIDRPDVRRRVTPGALAVVGAIAGGLSGLLGVGGGIVLVPAYTEALGLPLKTAIASSLVCVGTFAIPGTITHAVLDHIDWRFAIWLAVGVIPGARLGAAAAIRATDRRLQVTVASFLGLVAVAYAAGEMVALVD
jgi:uncharacterized protein